MGLQAFKSLAKQRARLVGELTKLEHRSAADQVRMLEIRSELAAFNTVLSAQGIDMAPEDFAPAVTPTPRKKYFAHGELLGMCLDALRTEARPLATLEILSLIIGIKQIRWRCLADRNELRRGIKDAMRVQVKRGVVIRVGTIAEGHDEMALWSLPEHAEKSWVRQP